MLMRARQLLVRYFFAFLAMHLVNSGTAQGAILCQSYFQDNELRTTFDKGLLRLAGRFVFKTLTFDGDIKQLSKSSEYIKILENAKNSRARLFGALEMPQRLGGGKLRLVRLTLNDSNIAYNHIELLALLQVNPELAHRIGLFEVPGYENLVWIPDVVQLNYRLKLIAEEQGIDGATWGYAPANGVIDFQPYIEMLSTGRFPFSNDKDLNLAVHDVMHATAFAAVNSTPASKKVMQASLKRAELVHNLYLQIKSDFPEVKNSFEKNAGLLVSDGLEKTMLLTILMTGNYNYFSALNQRKSGKVFDPQNKDITVQRVKKLLRLFVNGNVNFKKFHSLLRKESLSDSRKEKLIGLFQKTIRQLVSVGEAEYQNAAVEIVNQFFNPKIFSTEGAVYLKQHAAGINIDTLYPENPLDILISEGEQMMTF